MLGTTLNPKQFLDRVAAELGRIDPAEVKKLADLIGERYDAGRFVFVIGNGGSGSNASHFCEDMGKGTLDCVDAFGRTDFRPDLPSFTVPTLIIHGTSDKTVPVDISGRAL